MTACADEAVDAARNRATPFVPGPARAGALARSFAHFAARRSAADEKDGASAAVLTRLAAFVCLAEASRAASSVAFVAARSSSAPNGESSSGSA